MKIPEKTFDKNLYDFKEEVEFLALIAFILITGLFFALFYFKVIDFSFFISVQGFVLGVFFAIGLGAEIYFRKRHPNNSFPMFKI